LVGAWIPNSSQGGTMTSGIGSNLFEPERGILDEQDAI
jgi:hypothetical protein